MSAEKTTANRAADGRLTPRTSTVHVPVSGAWTSTCSTLFTLSYAPFVGSDQPFVYWSPWYSFPPGETTRRSRFRASVSPAGSSHVRVTFTGTSDFATLRLMGLCKEFPAPVQVPPPTSQTPGFVIVPIVNRFARGTV